MIYDIYHDESKEEAYWHIFLFIPRLRKNEIIFNLKLARQNTRFKGRKLHFVNLDSNTSFECTKSWLSILRASFQQVDKNKKEYFYAGKSDYNSSMNRRFSIFSKFDQVPRCKVAIFHLKNKHDDMDGHFDGLSRIETTFRMGLQGAAHYCFSVEDPLEIGKIFLDREEHYRIEHYREFDKNKVLNKLEYKMREYCKLASDCEIVGEDIEEDDNMLLELADLFLGTFRFGIIKPTAEVCSKVAEVAKYGLCKEIYPLILRLTQGFARMQNSRYNGFGTFSTAWIENGDWKFSNMEAKFLSLNEVSNTQLEFPMGHHPEPALVPSEAERA